MSSSNPLAEEFIPAKRRPSLLPHPSQVNSLFGDYSFPPKESPHDTDTSWNQYFQTNGVRERSMSYDFKLFSPTLQFMQEDVEEPQQQEDFFQASRSRSKSSSHTIMKTDIWGPQGDHFDWTPHQRRASSFAPSSSSSSSILPPQRRFSLAPVLESTPLMNGRRHSLANPSSNTIDQHLVEQIESLSIRENHNNNEVKLDDMGKGSRLDGLLLKDAIFYVVEFKKSRSDLFYSTQRYRKNDLVIVEADRGHDLGRICMENIQRHQLEKYYAQLKSVNHSTGELIQDIKTHYAASEIYIKTIFKSATPDEITLLMAKGQDEAKALMVCQSKIKQKKLNMQVVDAEYQWDRRKLTFYFTAEKRVDFRELVRELFKLYKTRIWMCAVSSISPLQE